MRSSVFWWSGLLLWLGNIVVGQPEIVGFQYLETNSQGFWVYQHQGTEGKTATGMRFVYILPGKFGMGSLPTEPGRYPDELYHTEILSFPFLMAETEVTQEVWKKVMGSAPWQGTKGKEFVQEGANYPAVYISWEDCQLFCEKTGLLLPSEAMWEYACRGKTDTAYYWGKEIDENYLWYQENTWKKEEKWAHEVRQKKPNGYGLYDMLGNVWEWCEDLYKPYRLGASSTSPEGPTAENFRVNRGGAFLVEAQDCRVAVRNYVSPEQKGFALGFRPVFVLPSEKETEEKK